MLIYYYYASYFLHSQFFQCISHNVKHQRLCHAWCYDATKIILWYSVYTEPKISVYSCPNKVSGQMLKCLNVWKCGQTLLQCSAGRNLGISSFQSYFQYHGNFLKYQNTNFTGLNCNMYLSNLWKLISCLFLYLSKQGYRLFVKSYFGNAFCVLQLAYSLKQ